MNLRHFIRYCAFPLVLSAVAGGAAAPRKQQSTLAALPGWFEPNRGQFPTAVEFFSRGSEGALLVERRGATFTAGNRSLRLQWERASAAGELTGAAPLPARSSYFTGADPRRWVKAVPHYAAVQARQLYAGVDVVYYLAGKQVEFDVVVAPGVDPAIVNFSFPGAGKPAQDAHGDLVFPNGMRQRAPLAYQEIGGQRVGVESAYRIARDGSVSFDIGQYDGGRPLVIDPVLHAGYLGGDQNDSANAIAVDAQGNVWIAGSSSSTVSLTDQYAPIQNAPAGARDAFVARLTPDASGRLILTYWTQLGGTDDDEATAITVGADGFVYVAGYTASIDFPRAGASVQDAFGGETDAFAAKIRIEDSGLDALWYSQYYGGNGRDVANGVAIDSAGAIYIAGQSLSDALPGVEGVGLQCCRRGGSEGFVAKFNPGSSSSLAYGTFLGGTSTDVIHAIAVDADGNVLVAGYTSSGDFPVTGGAYQDFMRSGTDAFLVKIDPRRTLLDGLVYGTFIGGGALDSARAIALAEGGDVWIGGYTASLDFPVTPDAWNTGNSGEVDGFLARFRLSSPDPSQSLVYASYFGGRGSDIVYSIAAGSGAAVALTGYTYSDDFPLSEPDGVAARPLQGAEAFMSYLDTAQSGRGALRYSAVIGGSNTDTATAIAIDRAGDLYATGYTRSANLPVTDGSTKLSPGGSSQSFVLATKDTGAVDPE